MNFFTDFKAINKVVFKKTNQAYFKNLILIPLFALYIFAYVLVNIILIMTLGQLGRAGYFLASLMTWFISCFMLSDFLEHIDNSLIGRKVSFKDIGSNHMRHFRPLLTATAVPRIVVYLFSALTGIGVPSIIILLFYLVYAIPEVVYQKQVDHLDMFTYGHKFLLENWQQWGIINAVFGLIILGYQSLISLITNPVMNALVNALPNSTSLQIIVPYIYLLFVWIPLAIPFMYYTIYRGFIFKILSVSSRRKREYMRNIYGK